MGAVSFLHSFSNRRPRQDSRRRFKTQCDIYRGDGANTPNKMGAKGTWLSKRWDSCRGKYQPERITAAAPQPIKQGGNDER